MTRRYLTVVQDPRGYPARGAPLEPAPPDGPAPPLIHSVVLADDFDRLADAAKELHAAVDALEVRVRGSEIVALNDLDAERRVTEALRAVQSVLEGE